MPEILYEIFGNLLSSFVPAVIAGFAFAATGIFAIAERRKSK